MINLYKKAQKQAQKEFRACTAAGQHPYLPVLDEFLPAERLNQGIDLGYLQIPLEFVVGTRTSGRTRAFSHSFMPLIEDGTEFATKWQILCQSHLEEGIRDPVKVYEYMNRYYVEEGNKRVSVLKFFEAATAYAHVIRILPQRDGTPEVEIYYEYLDFYAASKVNFLEFSKLGSYTQLQRFLGKVPGESWSDEDRSNLSAAYYYFRQAYEAIGGKQLTTTAGDAMLAYIRIYGYQDLRLKSAAEVKKSVVKMWEEFTLQQEQPPIDLKMVPAEEKPSGENLLIKVLPRRETMPMQVAFIHDKAPQLSGWTYGHELGRKHLELSFQGEVETAAYYNALDGDPEVVFDSAVANGSTVIVTTSPRLLSAALRAAVEHPEIIFLNCSLNKSHRYIRTYYARTYEAKFVSGAIAGTLAGGNNVGYICSYPIFGQVADINAFALGVQMTNPTVKIILEWSSKGGIKAAAKRLTDQGIRLISSQDLARQGDNGDSTFGLSLVNADGQVNLANPVCRWGVYYETILRRIWDKTFQSEYANSSKALNYYWGMSAGVVDIHCSDLLLDSTRHLADILKNSISSGVCQPFRGPLYAQDGQCMVKKGEVLTPEQIISMDWLAEDITGSIPTYEELDDMGKATVDVMGINLPDPNGAATVDKLL